MEYFAGLRTDTRADTGAQGVPFLLCHFSAGILFTGELWEFLSFAERYPAIIYNILLFGLTSALGQVSASRPGSLTSPKRTDLAGRRGQQD